LTKLVNQFIGGEIDVDTFIAKMDQKISMSSLEDQ